MSRFDIMAIMRHWAQTDRTYKALQMNPPTCRLCNREHWPRMGCKWANAAPQTDGNDEEIARLKRDLAEANRIVAAQRETIARQDAELMALSASVDALTLALSTPVDAPSTASTPGIDKPSTAGVYASTPSTIDTPTDRDRERKREWARKDRERRRLAAQRTKG